MTEAFHSLAGMRAGIVFALLTLAFGFGLGGAFGLRENAMKANLKKAGEEVLDTRYNGDHGALKKVTDKAWVYYKRAHLHANGLGTTTVVLIILLSHLKVAVRAKSLIALALGVGSLGYSAFWLLAGMRAPGLGSTGAAKATLEWLALPTATLCIVGLLAVIAAVSLSFFKTRD